MFLCGIGDGVAAVGMGLPSADGRTVYWIRHGTSEWNLLSKWQGQTDTLLAPEGELQARKAGAALAESGVLFDAVRCSDLKRATRTACLLAAACGDTSVEATPDPRLRECSLGLFEGMHKSEIFGPRFARLFKRLAALPHEARIRTAYFAELETPLQIANRALEATHELAASVPPGGTVALVTHSVVIESLCAAAFHKDFESVHTHTLAWVRCTWRPDCGLTLEETHGVEFASSPDALALDPSAAWLPPASATSSTSLGATNAVACVVGLLAAAAAGATHVGSASPRTATAAAVASLTSGLVMGLGAAVGFGGAVRDARIGAVAQRGVTSLAIAAVALVARGLVRASLSASKALSLAAALAAAQATIALASVCAAEVLTALGWRASLRAAPLGLWLPRVIVTSAARISGAMEDVASQGQGSAPGSPSEYPLGLASPPRRPTPGRGDMPSVEGQ